MSQLGPHSSPAPIRPNHWLPHFPIYVQLAQWTGIQNALDLLRSYFTGFLGEVQLEGNDVKLAKALTAGGILIKQTALGTSFRMASPLIDGFIRTRLFPFISPNAPAVPPPF
jgi:hypothetical protein